MNIGILVYDISLIGGAERVARNQADAFSNSYNVTVITLFQQEICDSLIENKRIRCETVSNRKGSITKNFIKYSNVIRKIIKENAIDILLSVTAGVVTLGIAAALGTRTKVVYAEHSNLENQTYGKKHILRQYLGAIFSDQIVTLTKRDRNNFIKMFRISPSKVVAIPNWYQGKYKKECQYKVNSKKIISVGRLEKVKGYDHLLNIAEKLRERLRGWTWDIYGDGSMREELLELSYQKKLADFVHFKGSFSQIPYSQYALYVMTSQYEGIPMSLLEAQSCGLPIISFDCPTGPSEIVSDGVNGFLISCYDDCEMANKILELLENEELRKKFSEKTNVKINKFDKGKIVLKWFSVFNELCERAL